MVEPYQPNEGSGSVARIIKVLVAVVVLVVAGSMVVYSSQIDRYPWSWKSEDWNNWMSFSKEVGQQVGEDVRDAGKKVGEKVGEVSKKVVDEIKEVDWSGMANKITSKTKGLFGQTEEVQAKIDTHREKTDTEYTAKYEGEAGQAYDYGLQWLDKGIKEWKVSLHHDGATERAKGYFEKALAQFQQAKEGNPELPLIDTFIEQSEQYLEDSTARAEKIRDLSMNLESSTEESAETESGSN